ncbi:pentapeptide repeat-containing protein [Herbidospora cretacea]|uniref:pentapeptide repeat-containing protein n=1 Tax=Herbidospora cretacea TaxID=28444 RepID=UPI00068CB885|nr:pentapeptide repeat-containing protein [Herbidospora cretacea]
MDLKHQQRHRWLHTFFLAAGIIATVGTLIVGTLTLRSGQEQLHITAEGQVTDRFFKAGEQLGSDKREIRTTAVYALERITKDSERDRLAIRDVLATFIRERDPAPTVEDDKLPLYPDADIAAALTVLARRPADPPGSPPLDLTDLRTPLMIFPPEANLKDVNLGGDSYLASVVLEGADLRDANLFTANPNAANLSDAHLNSANLSRANLTGAKLNGADLYDTDLRDADLNGADFEPRKPASREATQ